jgi:GT2 family glycosyltransferase/peptidoglycan/xylan/chitin deacetylase (PgdA/CDA1 family)
MTGTTDTPRLSVVVPTFQRRDVLARTLPTVLDLTMPAGSYEVVVVVDGSTDGTAEMLAERFAGCPVRTLLRDNAGPAAARNTGIQAARGDIILFLDDDLLCPPGLLAAHLEAHEGAPKVVLGPVLGLEGGSTAAELSRMALDEYYSRMRDLWDPNTSPTAYVAPNTSVPREVLLRAGGFDTRFARAHEDADLGLRLRAAGLPFTYLPHAAVHQLYTKDARALASADGALHGAGEVLLCRTHPGQRRYSFLARSGEGGILRRAARAACARSPVPAEWLLRPASWVAEQLPFTGLHRLRMALLSRRGYAARLRAAAAASGGWPALVREFGRRCPALLYHHVGPAQSGMPASLTVSPERFERHMRFLHRRGYTAISAGRWLDWMEAAVPLPPRSFVLTFDDGYADLADYAFPVLRRLGFSATVFVVADMIGRSNEWDAPVGAPVHRLLDWQSLMKWSTEGIEIGSHTSTHVALDDDSALDEIHRSRITLEEGLQTEVRTFAYPWGIAPPRARVAAATSYSLAFGIGDGVNTLATDPSLQRRTMVQCSDTLLDLQLRASLGWSLPSRLRSGLRLRSRARKLLLRQ